MNERRTAHVHPGAAPRTERRSGAAGDQAPVLLPEHPFVMRVGHRALWLLLAAAVVLAVVSLTSQVVLRTNGTSDGLFWRAGMLVDLDREANIPSWFQTTLLLLCAGALWTTGDRAGAGRVKSWRLLALIFAYLSLDEAASLHENLIEPLREALGVGGVLTFAWVLVGGPLALLVALTYVPFLRSLPRPTARRLVVAGAVYLGGALAVELVGGQIYSLGQEGTVLYAVVTTTEEVLEMSGLLLLLRALHLHTPSPARQHA